MVFFFSPPLAPRQSEENSSFAAASNFAEEKAEKNLKATQITRSYYIVEETLVPSFTEERSSPVKQIPLPVTF